MSAVSTATLAMSEAVVQRILLLLRIESSLKIKIHRTDKADLYLNRRAQMKSAELNSRIESSSRASWLASPHLGKKVLLPELTKPWWKDAEGGGCA